MTVNFQKLFFGNYFFQFFKIIFLQFYFFRFFFNFYFFSEFFSIYVIYMLNVIDGLIFYQRFTCYQSFLKAISVIFAEKI